MIQHYVHNFTNISLLHPIASVCICTEFKCTVIILTINKQPLATSVTSCGVFTGKKCKKMWVSHLTQCTCVNTQNLSWFKLDACHTVHKSTMKASNIWFWINISVTKYLFNFLRVSWKSTVILLTFFISIYSTQDHAINEAP